MKSLRYILSLALVSMLALGAPAHAVTTVTGSHFDGGKNLTQGNRKGAESTLAELMIDVQSNYATKTYATNKVLVITSAAGAGGAATEAMTVTGLLTTDTVLAVTQKTKGANSLPLLGWSTQAANALTGIWSADPGAGAVIMVTIKR